MHIHLQHSYTSIVSLVVEIPVPSCFHFHFSLWLINGVFFCETGVIHGDFNGMNIIVTPGSDHSGDYKLSGIIDLGNLMESYAVYDLAIAIAYMTMCSKNMDPLAVGYHVIEGHETEASLNEAEWKVLRVSCTCHDESCNRVLTTVYQNTPIISRPVGWFICSIENFLGFRTIRYNMYLWY